MQAHLNLRHTGKLGVNENHKDYKFSRWCYDTPGVVQPDQVRLLIAFYYCHGMLLVKALNLLVNVGEEINRFSFSWT